MSRSIAELSPAKLELLSRRLKSKRGTDARAQTIPRRGESDAPTPLSFAQQRLWFLDQLEPNSPLYNCPTAVRLKGRLAVGVLERALREVVRRHEVLRTSFRLAGHEPAQLVAGHAAPRLPLVDLRRVEAGARERRARRLAMEEARRPFDLSAAPLLRALLLRLSTDEHLLLVNIHHIATDGWSRGILMKEVVLLYEAYSRGRPSPLKELPVQYADYAVWQRGRLQGAALERHLAYWREQLRDAPPVLELPTDRPRAVPLSYRGAQEPVLIEQALVESLKGLSRGAGVTLFMTLLAAFKVVLRYYTGRHDIVIGTDVANRDRPETEGLIGFFVNQLVLRTDLSGDPSFEELLARVRQTTVGAYTHQELPFEKLVEALNPDRRASYSPFFLLKLTLQNPSPAMREAAGLTMEGVRLEKGTSQLDAIINLSENPEGLAGYVEYNTSLFDAATLARLVRRYEKVLRHVSAEPGARLSAIKEMLDEDGGQEMREAERKLAGANPRESAGGAGQNVGGAKLAVRRRSVTIRSESLIRAEYLGDGQTLPLVIRPAVEEMDLIAWTRGNRDFIETNLLKHGAVLFRGFNVKGAAAFEEVIRAFSGELLEYQERSSPRSRVSGRIYTSTDYPAAHRIFPHNENSYQQTWPLRIYFYCELPASGGGQTPIADCRKVYERIDPNIRRRLTEKRWMYVRNFGEGFGLGWEAVFQTTDRGAVEEHCRQRGIAAEWKGGDRLRISAVRPVSATHPRTGQATWFNHILPFHVTTLEPSVSAALLSEFGEEDLPSNSYYGDGSAIESEVLEHLRAAYMEETVAFDWQRDDLLLADNMLVAHGREPYAGARKVLVGMAEPFGEEER